MHSTIVLSLCLRVTVYRLSDRIDLPELESIQMEKWSLRYMDNGEFSSLIMRSDSRYVN